MTGACGINCDVCALKDKCGGCVPGNHPQAPQRLEQIKEMMGAYCPVLKCAMERNIDYCLRCPQFPCSIHYKWEIPYSKTLLDLIKKFKEEQY